MTQSVSDPADSRHHAADSTANKTRATPTKGNRNTKNTRPRNRRRSKSPKSKALAAARRQSHSPTRHELELTELERVPPQLPLTCVREVEAAAKFLGSCLIRSVGPERAAAVSATLTNLLASRYDTHWFPLEPTKGSGFRCLSNSPTRLDPVVQQALFTTLDKEHRITAVRSLPGQGDFQIWIDPLHVSVRVGEYGANTTIYGHQHQHVGGHTHAHAHTHAHTYPHTPPRRRAHRSPSPPRSGVNYRSLSPSAHTFTPTMFKGSPPQNAVAVTDTTASAPPAMGAIGTPPGSPKVQLKSRIPVHGTPARTTPGSSRDASPVRVETPPPGLGLDARWSQALVVSN